MKKYLIITILLMFGFYNQANAINVNNISGITKHATQSNIIDMMSDNH